MARAWCVLVLALVALAGAPAAAAAATVHLDAGAVQATDVRLQGPAVALDLRAPDDAPGALRVTVQALDLVVENDWANSTYAARVPLAAADHGQDEHPFGAARLQATSAAASGLPRILLLPMPGGFSIEASMVSAAGEPAGEGPTMANPVPYTVHGPVTADVDGTTAWTLSGGRLVADGSFLLIAWGVDLTVESGEGRLDLPTGERLTPTSPAAPEASGFVFEQQVHAYAIAAHLEVELAGEADAVAFLGPAAASWTTSARLTDVQGAVAGVEGIVAEGSSVRLAPGRLSAGAPDQGRIPLEVVLGAPEDGTGPALQASFDLDGSAGGWLSVPFLALALFVPGAGLPWLRHLHGRRFAEAERALDEGRLEAAAEAARRLAGSRWFGVDAAVLGAEACLRAGDARQALAFLDGRPWRPAAQALRLLLRARAKALQGQTAEASVALGAAIEGSPDLRAMARRDPLLQGMLDPSGREGYS